MNTKITIKQIEELSDTHLIEILPDGTIVTKELPKQDPLKILSKEFKDSTY